MVTIEYEFDAEDICRELQEKHNNKSKKKSKKKTLAQESQESAMRLSEEVDLGGF